MQPIRRLRGGISFSEKVSSSRRLKIGDAHTSEKQAIFCHHVFFFEQFEPQNQVPHSLCPSKSAQTTGKGECHVGTVYAKGVRSFTATPIPSPLAPSAVTGPGMGILSSTGIACSAMEARPPSLTAPSSSFLAAAGNAVELFWKVYIVTK